MRRKLHSFAFIAVAILLAQTASAAEIRVLNSNALTIAMKEIAADFTKETGTQVTFTGVSPGILDQKLKAGETYDLVIAATASAKAFEQEGKWRTGSRHPLARVGIGIAMREGAKPDLSTVESTRKLILGAKTITYSEPGGNGLSGANSQKVLGNLGLTDAVKDKTKFIKGDLAAAQAQIASGDIDLGLFNLSEIPRAPGVVRAGPVPASVEVYIDYDSAIPATNAAPDAAIALLNYFRRPAAHAVWDKAGLEVVGE